MIAVTVIEIYSYFDRASQWAPSTSLLIYFSLKNCILEPDKGFVDVMLLLHIKIAFKSGGHVLRPGFWLFVNGYLTTSLMKLSPEEFDT
jgi:hypothetical protein